MLSASNDSDSRQFRNYEVKPVGNARADAFAEISEGLRSLKIEIPQWCTDAKEIQRFRDGVIARDIQVYRLLYDILNKENTNEKD